MATQFRGHRSDEICHRVEISCTHVQVDSEVLFVLTIQVECKSFGFFFGLNHVFAFPPNSQSFIICSCPAGSSLRSHWAFELVVEGSGLWAYPRQPTVEVVLGMRMISSAVGIAVFARSSRVSAVRFAHS